MNPFRHSLAFSAAAIVIMHGIFAVSALIFS